MKLFIITCIIITSTTINTIAQANNPLDKIKAQKAAFITEKLGLTTTLAQKFWPVYNEFSSKKDSINNLRSTGIKEMKGKWDQMTTKQKEIALDKQMLLKFEETKVEQQYYEKFKKILAIDQVLKLYEAEHEFKMRLIKQIKENKTSQGTPNEKKTDSDCCIGSESKATKI